MLTFQKKIAIILFSLFSFLIFSPSNSLATIGAGQAGCHWSESSCSLVNKCYAGKVPVAHLTSIFCAQHNYALTCAWVTDTDCIDSVPPTSDVFQTVNPATKIPLNNTLSDILTNQGGTGGSFSIINLLIFAAGVVFFINIVIAGWGFMFSSGDPKKTASASTRLVNGFIGLIIVLASFLIVRLVSAIIGFNADPLI